MDFQWSPEQAAYRERLQAFLRENLPADFDRISRHGPASKELTDFCLEFCPKLAREGFLVPHWPVEYGGSAAPPWEHYILGEELWAVGEPRGGQYMNVNWVGPTIMKFGTDAQKKAFLPPMAEGNVLWCQGFSEPSAGSDLASLRTRADRDGDNYLINGQKIWTSYATYAEYCFLLARTSADRKKGISIFLLPMNAPGITVRSIPALVGEGDIHEVFFDNVVVPASAILGNPGEAWTIITFALANERVGIARYEFSKRSLDLMIDKLQVEGRFADSAIREAAAKALGYCEAARLLVYRIVDQRARGLPPSAESSVARWAVVQADHAVKNFALDFMPEAFSEDAEPLIIAHHERAIAAGIASGAAEIQLNIVSQQYLDLPREPRA